MSVVVFIFGTVMGSFFNVCIHRIPREESIVFPPSHCSHCGTRLRPYDLVPVASYIFLKGRCRYCGGRIAPRYVLVELFTGFAYLSLYRAYGISWDLLFYATLISFLIIASFTDIENGIVPDSVVMTGAAAGIVFDVAGGGIRFGDGLFGAAAGAGMLILINLFSLLFFKKQGMGGGDVKLMGMAGLYLGWRHVLFSIFLAILLGGFISSLLIIFKKKKPGDHIPFAPFLGIGVLITIFFGNEIISWYAGILR